MGREGCWLMSGGRCVKIDTSMESKTAGLVCAKHSGGGICFGKMMEQIALVNRGLGCAPARKAEAASGAARICRRVMHESMPEHAAGGQRVQKQINVCSPEFAVMYSRHREAGGKYAQKVRRVLLVVPVYRDGADSAN